MNSLATPNSFASEEPPVDPGNRKRKSNPTPRQDYYGMLWFAVHFLSEYHDLTPSPISKLSSEAKKSEQPQNAKRVGHEQVMHTQDRRHGQQHSQVRVETYGA